MVMDDETLSASITIRLSEPDKDLIWVTAQQVAAWKGYDATASAVLREALRGWATAERKKL